MKCTKCDAENKEAAKFCASCGNVMGRPAEPAPPALVKCPACHHENKASAKFCGKCRHPLATAPAPEAPLAPTAIALAEAAVEPVVVEMAQVEAAIPREQPSASVAPAQPRLEAPQEDADALPGVATSAEGACEPDLMPPAKPVATESASGSEHMETPQRNAEAVRIEPSAAAREETVRPAVQTRAHDERPNGSLNTKPMDVEPPKKSGNGVRMAVAVSAVVVIATSAGGWWWHSKKSADVAPALASAAPATTSAETTSSASAPEPNIHASSAPASAEASPAAAPVAPAEPSASAETVASTAQAPAPKEPPVPNTESAQLAKRKAAEEARKKKAEEAKARAQARNKPAQPTLMQAPAQAEPPAAPAPARTSSTQERVAQCQKENFLKREVCMWQVCTNKWGQDGCPAYKPQSTPSY